LTLYKQYHLRGDRRRLADLPLLGRSAFSRGAEREDHVYDRKIELLAAQRTPARTHANLHRPPLSKHSNARRAAQLRPSQHSCFRRSGTECGMLTLTVYGGASKAPALVLLQQDIFIVPGY
jgi:hypothetical protein